MSYFYDVIAPLLPSTPLSNSQLKTKTKRKKTISVQTQKRSFYYFRFQPNYENVANCSV